MDKHTARAIDNAWKDATNAKDKIGLAQLSHKLISAFEFAKMWLSLEPDECLVLSASGSIHKGSRSHVRLEKMTRLKEEYKTERHSDLLRVEADLKSAQEMYPMSVTGPRSRWDYRTRLAGEAPKAARKGRKAEPVVAADDI